MKRNYMIVWLIMVIFFVISFLTNIIGPLLPQAKVDFHLTLAQAGVLPFAFFIAYAVSIPAGYLIEKTSEKTVMIIACVICAFGSLLFGFMPTYPVFITSLFIMGAGVAFLQTAMWPLLRTAGGEENYSFNSVLTQIFFGAASFISPLVYSYIVVNLPIRPDSNAFLLTLSKLVSKDMSWASMYWIFGVVSILLVILIAVIKFPKVELKEDEKVEGFKTVLHLLGNKTVIIFFFGIFAYVGTEQGLSDWLSKFLSTYHGFDPNTIGAQTIAVFWALQSVGSILGILLLKLYDVKKVLAVFLILQLISLSFALFGPAYVSLVSFTICGFLTSLMYGSVFSLGLNSLDKHHGSFSGIMCTGIIGGAVMPFLIGLLGDVTSLRTGMFLIYLTILFMLYIAITAKPLVNNKTVKLRDLFKKEKKETA
ncbi:MAG: sugar MFS transporter [bacterium]|nr:sugar MFS transporter [bacterium]